MPSVPEMSELVFLRNTDIPLSKMGLTNKQIMAIVLFVYGNEQKKTGAKIMGITPQGFSDHIKGGLKKVFYFMGNGRVKPTNKIEPRKLFAKTISKSKKKRGEKMAQKKGKQNGFDFNDKYPHKAFQDDPTPPHKLFRKDDPETSKAAAFSLGDVTPLERKVYEVICRFPDGCISDQVREYFPGVAAYSSVTARYKALAEKGLIKFTGEKRPGKSGRGQRVMVAVKVAK